MSKGSLTGSADKLFGSAKWLHEKIEAKFEGEVRVLHTSASRQVAEFNVQRDGIRMHFLVFDEHDTRRREWVGIHVMFVPNKRGSYGLDYAGLQAIKAPNRLEAVADYLMTEIEQEYANMKLMRPAGVKVFAL